MSIASPEQLDFEQTKPIDGGWKQQTTVSVLCTGAGSYNLGYFMIILNRCGQDYVLDGPHLFLRNMVINAYATSKKLMLNHSCDHFF